jgi:hypothetical protein
MTRPYFNQVPNFKYVSRTADKQNISDYIEVKNLFKRGKLREDIFENLTFFTKYKIIGDERPDNVANKNYGDPTLDWVVLLANNILNIQSEWPLTQRAFDKVLLEKYGDYETLHTGIHHYETAGILNSNGITVLPSGLRVPNTWRTNGNFIEVNNTKIGDIFSGNRFEPSTTVTVTLNDGIYGLKVGSQIIINNVIESIYNGVFVVTSIENPFPNEPDLTVKFTYELSFTPDIASPILASPRIEEVLLTVESPNGTGNSYYYEYYDDGLGYSVQVPRASFIKEVTNFEYENQIEEDKRNIFILKPQYLNIVFNDMDDLMPYKKDGVQMLDSITKKGDNIRLYT